LVSGIIDNDIGLDVEEDKPHALPISSESGESGYVIEVRHQIAVRLECEEAVICHTASRLTDLTIPFGDAVIVYNEIGVGNLELDNDSVIEDDNWGTLGIDVEFTGLIDGRGYAFVERMDV
jgi:hypothetical protein